MNLEQLVKFSLLLGNSGSIVEKSQGSDLGNQLSSILMNRFSNMFIECTDEFRLYAISAYLDSRYSSYIPENERNCVESILINNYCLFYNDPNEKVSSVSIIEEEFLVDKDEQDDDLDELYSQGATVSILPKICNKGIGAELKYYNDLLNGTRTVLDRKVSGKELFKWRNEKKNDMKILQNLAVKLLQTPATSCSVERIFSEAGMINSPRRMRMKVETLSQLVFLNRNMKFIN